MKDFLSITDLSKEEIKEVWSMANKLKSNPYNELLKGKNILLLFEKPSTRTRVSFEVGINQMGGNPIYMDASTSQLSRGESIEDTGHTLERYVDMIVARVYRHEDLIKLAMNFSKPVINALSDLEHPAQILADYYTINEKFGKVEGLKLAFIGDGQNNVATSLILGAAILGVKIVIASPPKYQPKQAIIGLAEEIRKGTVEVTEDPIKAVSDADVVYTDVFTSMGQEKEKEERIKAFLPKYQVNDELLSKAPKHTLFMHCLPAHYGEEVTKEVIYGPKSIVFDQAENRLHVQKGLLLKMFKISLK
ncbi:MAG: ornithine carbamoyltransferase [Thaumarchaeota archaeon]|jgi:ornithine carbamoyltransferase|nr:ornithine carbamoyltransferase [Nitrososphaerota archaeon]